METKGMAHKTYLDNLKEHTHFSRLLEQQNAADTQQVVDEDDKKEDEDEDKKIKNPENNKQIADVPTSLITASEAVDYLITEAESQLATKLLTVVALLAASRVMISYAREVIRTKSERYCQTLWNDEKLYNLCRENFKMKQLQEEVKILQQAKAKCSSTDDPAKCISKVSEKIKKATSKISVCKFNISNFKKLPSLPRNRETSGSASITAGDLEATL